MPTERRIRHLFVLLRHANITARTDRLALLADILHHPVTTTTDLTDIQLQGVVDVLSHWNRNNELATRCAAILAARKDTHD